MGGAFAALRAAERKDAAELAILVDIGSHGFASWLWFSEVANGKTDTPLEYGRLKMSRDGEWGSWQNAVVAEAYGEVAGAAVGYELGEGIHALKTDRPALAPVIAMQKTVAGGWFIGTLAVYRHLRGIGIGRKLLGDQIDRANGLPVSLITASDNDAALALYKKNGFSEAARADAVPLFEGSKKHEWVLLTRLAG
jgi:ribosomal protein S18 acetylase RimI-like enzyme